MKKIICILLIALFTISLSYGRDYSKVKYNLDTPFTGVFTAERFTGDSAFFHNEGDVETGGYSVYKRSKDGLRDTVFNYSGAESVMEYVYSPEGKLVTMNFLEPDLTNLTKIVWITGYGINYQYDAEGRIAVIKYNSGGSTIYDYTENTIVFEGKDGEPADTAHVVYTDNGYIFQTKKDFYLGEEKVEYVFDSENRLLKRIHWPLYDGDDKTEFIYEYTDHGYCIYSGDSYKEERIYFEKESRLKKYISYKKTIHGWEIDRTSDYVYYYGDMILDVDEPAVEKTAKIYGVTGGVVMELEAPTQVAIYALSGQLVRRQYFDSGSYQLPMVPGFYIVQAGKDIFKLKVR